MQVNLEFQPKDGLISVLYKKVAEFDAAERENRSRNGGLYGYVAVEARSYQGMKMEVCVHVYSKTESNGAQTLYKSDFYLHEHTEESLEKVFDEAIKTFNLSSKEVRVRAIDLFIEKLQAEKQNLEKE